MTGDKVDKTRDTYTAVLHDLKLGCKKDEVSEAGMQKTARTET